MKKIISKKVSLLSTIFLVAGLGLCTSLSAQTVFHAQVVEITLNGTSNLHDWDMKAVNGESEMAIGVDANNKVSSLNRLSFKLPVKNLKSHHSGMDNNTYKALNADKNPNISFVLTSATVIAAGNNNYQFNCLGKLTIAGVTRDVTLPASCTYNPTDKTFAVNGSKKMNMTDYNVKPPTAIFGTIKTGNPIVIAYNLKFKK